jgi:hypothetical protein
MNKYYNLEPNLELKHYNLCKETRDQMEQVSEFRANLLRAGVLDACGHMIRPGAAV